MWPGRRTVASLVGVLAVLLVSVPADRATAQDEDWPRLVAEIMGPSTLEENLRELLDEIGGRMSGSEGNRRSVEWAVEAFRRAGVDSVTTEALTLPVGWREGETRAAVMVPVAFPLRAVSIAWSPPTPPGGIEAPVVDLGFGSEEEFARVSDRLPGALLLVNRAVLETWDDLFDEYATAPPVLERAVAAGAAGVLWISTKERGVLYRHINTPGQVDVLPQAIVAREDGLRISRLAAGPKEVRVRLEMPNEISGPFEIENVVAEIRGGDMADEVVALGAHLDSWDLGTGALDNGANVALVIEVARAVRAAGIRPQRTLRFLLWNGEEQGLRGSRGYVARHRDELDAYVAYLNIDGGIGSVNGFAVAGRPEVLAAIEEMMRPLEGLGVSEHLLDTYGGSDHVDFLLEGIPILDANQPVANYLPNYHASSDTLDKVPLRDLRLNAVVMATALLGVSDRNARIGHRMSRAEVERHVEETGFSSYLVGEGIWDEFLAGTRGRALEPPGDPFGLIEAAKTPEGLIRALYDMVSFDAGPEPDWEMFRDVFLEDALIVFSPMGERPMRPMGVDGFIQDWKDFFRDYELADKGFYESIADLEITEFGGLAHAFVIFEPRIGKEAPARQLRGLDSIELAFDGERWWVAAITTDFETPDKPIPPGIGASPRPDSGDPE